MTGTASTSAPELRKIYKVNCVPVPTNRPAIRKQLPTLVFGSTEEKWKAVVEEIKEMHALGRPVLIGHAEHRQERDYLANARSVGRAA